LGIFGPGDLFPGPDLQGPPSGTPDGIQYGITSAADNILTGNGGLSGQHLIKNSVVFTLSGWGGEPDVMITDVTFQYGTSLGEPQYVGIVPEPSTAVLALMAFGFVALRFGRRRPTPRT
jgi:hypothetical protein